MQSIAAGVDQFLVLVYLLLALAIVIAVIGIANTLALSVHERTRELGLLRAVGQTRPQVRSMVRWESVIIAVFGALGGLGLGVFLGWALVTAASSGDLSVFAAAAGPARRHRGRRLAGRHLGRPPPGQAGRPPRRPPGHRHGLARPQSASPP